MPWDPSWSTDTAHKKNHTVNANGFQLFIPMLVSLGKKYPAEVELCKKADQVVAIGPKLASTYSRCFGKGKVLVLTPGVPSEFPDIKQNIEEREIFHVLVFGRGDSEDFLLKRYDIAAPAVAKLNEPFKRVFVGAANGREEQVKEMLLKKGISHSQLIVRSAKERKQLGHQFYKADLLIMPLRTEGFGLAALEALSAGLPVLVSFNSGLGEALEKVPFVVNSNDQTDPGSSWKGQKRTVEGSQ